MFPLNLPHEVISTCPVDTITPLKTPAITAFSVLTFEKTSPVSLTISPCSEINSPLNLPSILVEPLENNLPIISVFSEMVVCNF